MGNFTLNIICNLLLFQHDGTVDVAQLAFHSISYILWHIKILYNQVCLKSITKADPGKVSNYEKI